MRKNGKLDECEKAKMESAFNFVCGRVRLLKQIIHIVTWSLVKKSFKWSLAIIGAISTIMSCGRVSHRPASERFDARLGSLCSSSYLVFYWPSAAIVTYHHNKDGVHLFINGMDVDIVVDDLLYCGR